MKGKFCLKVKATSCSPLISETTLLAVGYFLITWLSQKITSHCIYIESDIHHALITCLIRFPDSCGILSASIISKPPLQLYLLLLLFSLVETLRNFIPSLVESQALSLSSLETFYRKNQNIKKFKSFAI